MVVLICCWGVRAGRAGRAGRDDDVEEEEEEDEEDEEEVDDDDDDDEEDKEEARASMAEVDPAKEEAVVATNEEVPLMYCLSSCLEILGWLAVLLSVME